ncbi:MAG TPA: adenylate/guanylate cyclase domain-containing protein [Terrimicrobiaceae bacterium]
MNETDITRIASWLVKRGLAGMQEADLLHGFCEECGQTSVDLSTAVAVIDTLHPVYEGRAFLWRSDGAKVEQLGGMKFENTTLEYSSTAEGEAADYWQKSVFYHLLTTGADETRRRIGGGDSTDFETLKELKAAGETDFIAFLHRFAKDSVIGEMDCVYSHWTTRHPDGFSDADLTGLRRLVPSLALAIKCASLARIAGTLVEVYLGRDAGQRVLGGHISRGVAERINTVLWFSDLRGYTTIADTTSPDAIIPLLNDYAEVVISSIHEAGGDVLKLIGDGVLAVFNTDDPAEACRRALSAEANLRTKIEALNASRAAKGHPVSNVYLGLHIGDVFYGNIGSDERLDFTVVGPAVNEVSRIASMCRSVDRLIVVSAEFAAATPQPERENLVSVGRYALRGVARAQELFTLDPGMRPPPSVSLAPS